MAQKIDFCDFLVYLGKNTKGGDTTIFLKNYLGGGRIMSPPLVCTDEVTISLLELFIAAKNGMKACSCGELTFFVIFNLYYG